MYDETQCDVKQYVCGVAYRRDGTQRWDNTSENLIYSDSVVGMNAVGRESDNGYVKNKMFPYIKQGIKIFSSKCTVLFKYESINEKRMISPGFIRLHYSYFANADNFLVNQYCRWKY